MLLGHASIATTERYTAVDDTEIRAAMNAAAADCGNALPGVGPRRPAHRLHCSQRFGGAGILGWRCHRSSTTLIVSLGGSTAIVDGQIWLSPGRRGL